MLKLIKELLFGKPIEDTKVAEKVDLKQEDLKPVITPVIMPMSSGDSATAKKTSKKKTAVKKDPAVKKPRGRKPKAAE